MLRPAPWETPFQCPFCRVHRALAHPLPSTRLAYGTRKPLCTVGLSLTHLDGAEARGATEAGPCSLSPPPQGQPGCGSRRVVPSGQLQSGTTWTVSVVFHSWEQSLVSPWVQAPALSLCAHSPQGWSWLFLGMRHCGSEHL